MTDRNRSFSTALGAVVVLIVVAALAAMLADGGLRATDIKAGCGRCGACSALSTYEREADQAAKMARQEACA